MLMVTFMSTFALMLVICHSHFIPITVLVFEILICTQPTFTVHTVFTKKRSQWDIIHFLFNTEYWGVFQTKIFSVAVFEIKSNVKNRLCKYLGTLIIFMI